METKTLTGKIKGISNRDVLLKSGKKSKATDLEIGDAVYSTLNEISVLPGEIVTIEYTVNGIFNNITKLQPALPTEKPATQTTLPTEKKPDGMEIWASLKIAAIATNSKAPTVKELMAYAAEMRAEARKLQ